MSQLSLETRKLAIAGVAALAALGAATSTAQAAKLTLNYQCKYPLIGVQPLSIDIDAAIPESIPAGSKTPAFSINAVATAGGNTAKAIETIGAQTLEGVASANSTVTIPGGGTQPVTVPITVAKWTRPAAVPNPLVLSAFGKTPSLTFDEPGTASVTVDKLSLNLLARDKNGAPISLAPVTTDVDGAAITPSDSDPGTFDVPCKLTAGQSTTLAQIQVLDGSAPVDTTAPSKPTGLKGTPSTSAVALSWNSSTDNVKVESYDVLQGGTRVTSTSGTSVLLGGLTPSSAYSFTVVAKDAAGNATSSDAFSVSTLASGDGGPGGNLINYGYSILGSSTLKTLTNGNVPVSGSIAARFNLTTGDFTGDLALNKTRAKLSLINFIPVTADVAFVNEGKTVGKLENGVLTATARLKIRLPQLYLFGAIPVAGPGTCQTKSISTIPLRSSDAFFDPLSGGTLKGTYAISDLTGCGALNDIISPFAAGGGNTLSIKLTPKQ